MVFLTASSTPTTGQPWNQLSKSYGDRGIRYVHMEVGFAAQNIYLQAESLNLGTVFIGAFYDDLVKKALQLGDEEQPLSLMPVGSKEKNFFT